MAKCPVYGHRIFSPPAHGQCTHFLEQIIFRSILTCDLGSTAQRATHWTIARLSDSELHFYLPRKYFCHQSHPQFLCFLYILSDFKKCVKRCCKRTPSQKRNRDSLYLSTDFLSEDLDTWVVYGIGISDDFSRRVVVRLWHPMRPVRHHPFLEFCRQCLS